MSILKGGEDDDSYNAAFLGADLELDNSRRREVSLYRHNELVLTVEHGVTLGFLKLLYSSDPKYSGILQGVKSRSTSNQSPVTSVLLSDERVLDQDEYELIVLDQAGHSTLLQQNLAPPLPNPVSNITLADTQQSSVVNSNSQHQHHQQENLSATTNISEKKTGNFVCEYCHLPFVSKAKFLRHRRIHTEENPYECVHCHQSFSHHVDLRNHRNEHHMTNKTFKCSFCPKTFSARAELKGHLWRHTGEKNEKCQICGKTFATKGNLKLHVDKHIGVLKHKCPFCPQNFTSHSSLEAHMAKHTGMKAYKCRYCAKSYAQAGQLTSHERVHTGEKPFVCQVCGKGFRLNSTRLAHEKRHSGVRPHICDTCGRSFSMPDHLRRHLKTHEDKLDRLVPCPFCKKKIFSGRNMRKHLIRHRELGLTEEQAKAISSSLKPDRDLNERDALDEDQRSSVSIPRGGSSTNVRPLIRCVECSEEVKSVRKLFEHMTSVHYQRELSVVERKEIRLKHGLQKLHHCPFCSAYFVDYRLLRSHVLADHPSRAGEIGFASRNKVTIEASNVNATHKCPNCSMFFHLRGALDQHIIKEHLTTVIESGNATAGAEEVTPSQFRCWYCRLSFPSTEEVVSHMTSQHESLDVISKRVEKMTTGENDVTTSGLWTCSHCPVTLKSHEEYIVHVSLHSAKVATEMAATAPASSSVASASSNLLIKGASTNKPSIPTADDANKYLNPMRIECKSSNVVLPNHHQVIDDKYFTVINNASSSIAVMGNPQSMANVHVNAAAGKVKTVLTPGEKELTAAKTTTTSSTGEEVVDPSNEEMYLTTSSLSATVADVNLASSDLTQVDFLRLFSNEHMQDLSDDEEYDDEDDDEDCGNLQVIIKCEEIDRNQLSLNHQLSFNHQLYKKVARKKQRNPVVVDFDRAKMRRNFLSSPTFDIVVNESCKVCSAVFKSKAELQSHMKRSHTEESSSSSTVPVPFRCWFCAETFVSPEEVVAHMTNEHDNLDNLSRIVTDVTTTTTNNNSSSTKSATSAVVVDSKSLSKLKHLKRSLDASLSPIDGHACPKCPKKLGSKEAFELHLMVHETLESNRDQEEDGQPNSHLLSRQKILDRSPPTSSSSSNLYEVSLSAEPIPMVEGEALNLTMTEAAKANNSKPEPSSNNKKSTLKKKPTSVNATTTTKKRSKKKAGLMNNKKNKSFYNNNSSVFVDGAGNTNIAANMCTHCSRVFCGKKALYVHTLKMHGKEYLQKHTPPVKQNPFSCWFCSASFGNPELVVEHMTEAHENLDKLSKRVERQNLTPSSSPSSSAHTRHLNVRGRGHRDTEESSTVDFPRFIPIPSSQKQLVPVSSLRSSSSSSSAMISQQPLLARKFENGQQPPAGFKVSYALAYVPVYVPDKAESCSEEDTTVERMGNEKKIR